jgi:hypothetical protein
MKSLSLQVAQIYSAFLFFEDRFSKKALVELFEEKASLTPPVLKEIEK